MKLKSDVIYPSYLTAKHTIAKKAVFSGSFLECYLRHAEQLEFYLVSREFANDHKVKKVTLGKVLKIYLAHQAKKVFENEVKESNFDMHHSSYFAIRNGYPKITMLKAHNVFYEDISHLNDHHINFIKQAYNFSASINIINQKPTFPKKKQIKKD